MTEKRTKWLRLHPGPRQQEQGIYQYCYDEYTIMGDDVIVVRGDQELTPWLDKNTEDLGEFEWSDGRVIRLMRVKDPKALILAHLCDILPKQEVLEELWLTEHSRSPK